MELVAALHQMHVPAEVVTYQRWLLWSINDRLGGGAGIAVPKPTDDWLHDVVEFEIMANEEYAEMRAEMNKDKF